MIWLKSKSCDWIYDLVQWLVLIVSRQRPPGDIDYKLGKLEGTESKSELLQVKDSKVIFCEVLLFCFKEMQKKTAMTIEALLQILYNVQMTTSQKLGVLKKLAFLKYCKTFFSDLTKVTRQGLLKICTLYREALLEKCVRNTDLTYFSAFWTIFSGKSK